MITETRVPTPEELPLPPAFESERSKWLIYLINWDNVTSNPYQTEHAVSGGSAVIFRGNNVTGDTDFIAEQGRLLAMRPVLGPANIASFSANCLDLKATPADSLARFGISMQTRLAFSQGSAPYPFYEFDTEAMYSLPLSSAAGPYGNDVARVYTGPTNFDYAQDVIHFDDSGQSGSSSDLVMYGVRHNGLTTPQNYINGINADALPTPAGGTRHATGLLQLREDLRTSAMGPFPIVATNPAKLYLNYSWQYGAFSDPKDSLGGTTYSAPNSDSSLGDRQQYQPQIIGVCVLFEKLVRATRSAFWHPTKAVYEAFDDGNDVRITRRAGVSAPQTTIFVLAGHRNPSIWQRRLNGRLSDSIEIVARHIESGQWRFYRSQNGGKTFTYMASPFESTAIENLVSTATRSGAAAAAFLGGKLVFKQTGDTEAWPPDAEAVLVRSGVANSPLSLSLSPDGHDDFLITTNQACYSSKGGKVWP